MDESATPNEAAALERGNGNGENLAAATPAPLRFPFRGWSPLGRWTERGLYAVRDGRLFRVYPAIDPGDAWADDWPPT